MRKSIRVPAILLQLPLLVLAALVLVGCATPHTIIFKDGSEVRTKDEPSFNDRTGFYEFKDEAGKKHQVNKDEIRSVREGE